MAGRGRQEQKALEILRDEYEFAVTTAIEPAEVYRVADRVAADLKIGLGGSLKRMEGSKKLAEDIEVRRYELLGPGGFISVAIMALFTWPEPGGAGAQLRFEAWTFQKGSLGMKPTINGSKFLIPFARTLKIELLAR